MPQAIQEYRIEARRWFQKSFGNTYHSVRIWDGEDLVAHEPFAYGYDDQWMQTATDILTGMGVKVPNGALSSRVIRENNISATVTDVKTKRAL